MAVDIKKRNMAYGMGAPLLEMKPLTIVAQRAPTTSDRAEIGQDWVDQVAEDVYVLVKVTGGVSTWMNTAGGAGVFNNLTVTTWAIIGDSLSMLAGTLTITADDDVAQVIYLHADAGTSETIDIHADQGTGVASIYMHSDVGGVSIASGLASADAINIFASDAAGGLDIDVGSAGIIAAATGGPITFTSTSAAAQGIYLHTNGGVLETIDIYADQGTDTASVYIHSDVGGVTIDGGVALANAVSIAASDAAGGITLQSGTGGMGFTATGGPIEMGSTSTAAQAIYMHTNGGVLETIDIHALQGTDTASVYIHSDVGGVTIDGGVALANAVSIAASDAAGGITLQCGTGGMGLAAVGGSIDIGATEDIADAIFLHTNGGTTETITIQALQGTAVDSIELASTAGGIRIDAGLAAANSIAIDASDAAGGIDIDAGSAGIDVLATLGSVTVGATEDAADAIYLHANGGVSETIRLHSDLGTGTDSINLVSDVGGITLTSGLNAVDAIYLHTDAGITEQIHLLSTQGTASASVHLQSIVGGVALTAGLAGAASIVINASDAAGGLDIDYGTGGCTIDATNGAFTLQTGTGTVSLGADAVAKSLVIGNTTGATDISLDAGSGGIDINSAGLVTMTPLAVTVAGAAITASANYAVCTFTGLTTAANTVERLTITNTLCTATSAILCTVSNMSTTASFVAVHNVVPGVGSFTVDVINTNGTAAAVDGNIILTFWIPTV